MRIRTIKPEFWRSEDIAALDWDTRLLFIGLWSYVDDNGVGRDSARIIAAELFALDSGDYRDTLARVSGGLDLLSERGLIVRYVSAGVAYVEIATWDRHQRIDKPNKARYPRSDDESAVPSRHSREIPAPGTEEQGNRGTGEQAPPKGGAARKRGHRIPEPFLVTHDMRDWAAENVPAVDVDESTRRFVDYWRGESGAKASKLDWEATWRNWLRRDAERAHPTQGNRAQQRQNESLANVAQLASLDAARQKGISA